MCVMSGRSGSHELASCRRLSTPRRGQFSSESGVITCPECQNGKSEPVVHQTLAVGIIRHRDEPSKWGGGAGIRLPPFSMQETRRPELGVAGTEEGEGV